MRSRAAEKAGLVGMAEKARWLKQSHENRFQMPRGMLRIRTGSARGYSVPDRTVSAGIRHTRHSCVSFEQVTRARRSTFISVESGNVLGKLTARMPAAVARNSSEPVINFIASTVGPGLNTSQ